MADFAAIGLDHMRGAYDAVRAERSAAAAEITARQAKNRATYTMMTRVALADAARQLMFRRAKKRVEQGNPQDGDAVIMERYKSAAKYLGYVHETLRVEPDSQISKTRFTEHAKHFWCLALSHAPLDYGGVTIDRVALDKSEWTDSSAAKSMLAAERTLLYVLQEGFGAALLARLPTDGWNKSFDRLMQEMTGRACNGRVIRARPQGPPYRSRPRVHQYEDAAAATDDDAQLPPPDGTIHRVEPESGSESGSEVVALKEELAATKADRDGWKYTCFILFFGKVSLMYYYTYYN